MDGPLRPPETTRKYNYKDTRFEWMKADIKVSKRNRVKNENSHPDGCMQITQVPEMMH
jgi:hypothetical protein